MNRIFGLAAACDAGHRCRAAARWVAGRGAHDTSLLLDGPTLALGCTSDGGAVLGRARHADLAIAMLGWLRPPAPDWRRGSPLDDPDVAARYLLDRYRSRGDAFLDGLSGSYVLALTQADRLLLARDPWGSRRLFLFQDGDSLRFASHLADMRGLLGDALEVDRSLEDFLLGYEFLPWNRTLFRGVSVLQAGCIVSWQRGGSSRRAIANPPTRNRAQGDETAVVSQLEEVFMRAVEDQAPSSGRVAVLLGGFDSALVASALHRLGKQVETFSFQYGDARYDQPHTNDLARALDIRHNWVPITPQGLRQGVQTYANAFNQPVSQTHYMLSTATACREIRDRGFTHCFTGDGCDGLFLGYPTVHQRAQLILQLSRLARIMRPLELLARSARLERRLGHPYRTARNVLRILRREMPARGHIAACTLDEFSLSLLRRSPPPDQERHPEAILEQLARGLADISPVRLAYLGKGAVGLNRNKLEGSSAASGVCLESPFMHPEMMAFSASLPDELSRPDRKTRAKATGKHVLMQMAERRGFLPPEIIHQPKRSPVTAPVDTWYMGPLRDFMLSQLDGLPFEWHRPYAEALLAPKLAEDWFRRYVGISRYTSHAINLLVTYASFTRLAR